MLGRLTQHALVALLLTAVLQLLWCPQHVLADSHDDDDDEVDNDVVSERSWTIEDRTTEQVTIKGEVVTGDVEDEIELEVRQRDNGHEFRVEYSSEAGSTESEVDFRLRSYRLVEYLPLNSSYTAFNKADSTILSTLELGSWDDLLLTTSNESLTVYNITSISTDGVFRAEIFISTAETPYARDTSVTLNPNSGKATFIISTYPYVGTDSRLALECAMRFSTEVNVELDTDLTSWNEYDGIKLADKRDTAVPYSATLDWAKTAIIDGVQKSVFATSYEVLASTDAARDDEASEKDSECSMYFSFDGIQPSKIEWDPTYDVTYSKTSSANLALPSFVVSVLLLASSWALSL